MATPAGSKSVSEGTPQVEIYFDNPMKVAITVALEVILGGALLGGGVYFAHINSWSTTALTKLAAGGIGSIAVIALSTVGLMKNTRTTYTPDSTATDFGNGNVQKESTKKSQALRNPSAATAPKVTIKAQIYFTDTRSQYIHTQNSPSFKDSLGNEIPIHPDEQFIQFEGDFACGRELYPKLPYSNSLYFPSSLLKDVKEGDTKCFYIGNEYVEFTFTQKNHPNPLQQEPLENFVQAIQSCAVKIPERDLFLAGSFFDQFAVGPHLQRYNCEDHSLSPLDSFDYFIEDQKTGGTYVRMEAPDYLQTEDYSTLVLNVCKTRDGIDLKNIHIILAQGATSQIWILIPHKPEKNCVRQTATTGVNIINNGTRSRIQPNEFDPKKGDRTPLYRHGVYFVMETAKDINEFRIEFIKRGDTEYLSIYHPKAHFD